MSALTLSGIIFALTLGGIFLGTLLRRALPEHHLSSVSHRGRIGKVKAIKPPGPHAHSVHLAFDQPLADFPSLGENFAICIFRSISPPRSECQDRRAQRQTAAPRAVNVRRRVILICGSLVRDSPDEP